MLAWVGLLSPTAFGNQLYKTQPLLKAPVFNSVCFAWEANTNSWQSWGYWSCSSWRRKF